MSHILSPGAVWHCLLTHAESAGNGRSGSSEVSASTQGKTPLSSFRLSKKREVRDKVQRRTRRKVRKKSRVGRHPRELAGH